MLMTVQLPRDLRIPHRSKIQIPDPEPQIAARPFPMHTVRMPINFAPIIQASIAQKIEVVLANLLGAPDNFLRLLGHASSQQIYPAWNIFAAEKKPTSPRLRPTNLSARRINPQSEQNPVCTFLQFLTNPIRNFRAAHQCDSREMVAHWLFIRHAQS